MTGPPQGFKNLSQNSASFLKVHSMYRQILENALCHIHEDELLATSENFSQLTTVVIYRGGPAMVIKILPKDQHLRNVSRTYNTS